MFFLGGGHNVFFLIFSVGLKSAFNYFSVFTIKDFRLGILYRDLEK